MEGVGLVDIKCCKIELWIIPNCYVQVCNNSGHESPNASTPNLSPSSSITTGTPRGTSPHMPLERYRSMLHASSSSPACPSNQSL